MLEITNYEKNYDITEVTLLVKLEYFNPAGSVKDRIALREENFCRHTAHSLF